MRFITVQPHLRAGGSETQTVLRSNGLVARGIDTHLILHSAEGELLEHLDPRITVHDLGLPSHAQLPLTSIRLARTLARFDEAFVAVVLWSSLLAVQPAAALLPRLRFAMCEDLDPAEHWKQLRFGGLKRRLIRPIFRHHELVLANTESVSDRMVEAYGLKKRPTTLYGGIDAARVRALANAPALDPKSSDDVLRIATVASLRERKGHERVLRSLSELERPWEWHVIGTGPDEARLRNSVPVNLRERIHWHGALSNPFAVLSRCDVMVHLAHSEAFGLVLLEALALGLPVVSSRCIGPLEIGAKIDQTETHLRFVDAENPREVAAAIDEVSVSHTDNPVPSRFGSAFDVHTTVDAWVELASATEVRPRRRADR